MGIHIPLDLIEAASFGRTQPTDGLSAKEVKNAIESPPQDTDPTLFPGSSFPIHSHLAIIRIIHSRRQHVIGKEL
jgi:hypothetical protein